MAEKKVSISIAAADFEMLRSAGYYLCFAKKIKRKDKESYTVIWSSTNTFLSNSDFFWEPCYQIYASNTSAYAAANDSRTDVRTIEPGQKCILNSLGFLMEAQGGGIPTGFTLENQYQPIYVNLTQKCRNIEGMTDFKKMYVSDNQVITGIHDMEPTEKVIIWFEESARDGEAVPERPGNIIELDLDDVDSRSVKYENGIWAVV